MSSTDPTSHIAQLRELLDSRLALAKLEVQHDIACSRRLGIIAGTGSVVAIIGLTFLSFVLANYLAALTQTDPLWWQLGFGVVMVTAGTTAIFFSWRSFRREFSGLRETLDELREDQRWLSELASEVLPEASNPPTTPANDG